MRWLDKQLRHSVVVHLVSKESVRGVLVGVYRDCLVIAHAYYLNDDSPPTEVDGEVVIPRGQVAWIQKLYESGGDNP